MLEGSGARLVRGIFWRNTGKLHSMVHLHSCVGLARFAGLNVRYHNSMRACLNVRSCMPMRLKIGRG
jgi:hypothetical protein